MRKTQKMATMNVINTTITIFRLSSSKEALVGGLIDGCRVGTGVVMAESWPRWTDVSPVERQ